ncbi:hypothetical protein HON86_01615 [Candidatus Woesearchaeota archaeon]|nr:hypothetical protein [Candidatus Woesearchaeota archaeon]MBT4835300.1 hypothetical protein [Candidatus Woesearchaeota archaeon]MBT6735366.1 hypothetical protein [Candidatus Woesearchaeota archaeon]MBT7169965.1 hypothetical protein [Candidatus Woesearchaeota archaeon]MBT7474477.1 hypothetical protein [Candidatus Woesearchaeota archaeon]
MNKIILIFVILLCIVNVQGATLHGSTYNLDFDLITNTLIEINSEPKQSMIAKEGAYTFKLNNGNYVINAKYYSGDEIIASTQEKINIIEEGDYVLDLILFPTFDNVEADFEIDLEEETNYLIPIIITILAISIIIALTKKKKKIIEENDELDDVLNLIKKEGGRITQKNIRKSLGLSEAKASLIITELEHKEIIKRIKKGRGNIIILQK